MIDSVSYAVYENELQMPDIMKLIQKDLSEPYSIYTYRYFIHNWPHLCYMVRDVLTFQKIVIEYRVRNKFSDTLDMPFVGKWLT